jgi:hypothetical protein
MCHLNVPLTVFLTNSNGLYPPLLSFINFQCSAFRAQLESHSSLSEQTKKQSKIDQNKEESLVTTVS